MAYRAAAGLGLAALLLIVWATLAVGFVGEPDHPANLMYFGVVAVALLGGALSRFDARGLAAAFGATVVAMAAAATVTVVLGLDRAALMLGLHAFFMVLLGGAAWLFRAAAAEMAGAGDVSTAAAGGGGVGGARGVSTLTAGCRPPYT